MATALSPGQMDDDQIGKLVTFHRLLAGLIALFSMFPMLHVAVGLLLISGILPATSPTPGTHAAASEVDFVGWMFVVMGLCVVLTGLLCASALAYNSRLLARRERYTVCIIITALECCMTPFGLVLGIFSLIVLLRRSVVYQFAANLPPGKADAMLGVTHHSPAATPLPASLPPAKSKVATMPPPSATAESQDEQHLKLLSLFHYVASGLCAFFALFPIMHVIVGIIFILNADKMGPPGQPGPPPFFGWIFVVFGSFFILIGMSLAAAIAYNGRLIARRRRLTLCLILSGIECVFMPFGTAVGVFSFVVLNRPSVKELFEA